MKNWLHIFKKIHRWLGIISGPIVFVIAITGCLYAFQEEFQEMTQPFRFFKKTGQTILSPTEIKDIAVKNQSDKKVHAVMVYSDNHAAKVIFYEFDKYYQISYINPETGRILAHIDQESGFFAFILKGHFYLWLPPGIGQPFVAVATLVFVVVILVGLIIWWPRSGNKKSRFKIKKSTSWKRRNFDLHSVIGFYSLIFALIFAITGLVWGFEWFRNSYYKLFSGGDNFISYYEPMSSSNKSKTNFMVDQVFYRLSRKTPDFHYIEVHFPEKNHESIAANVNKEIGTFWKTDYYYFDQNTLQELPVAHYWGKFSESSIADKMMRLNYDIHTGGLFGIAGKIFAFLLSLAIATLPITGFIFWLGKKKKSLKRLSI